jgi:dTDP-4-amino-4,6-dideoxygalactose transaminase
MIAAPQKRPTTRSQTAIPFIDLGAQRRRLGSRIDAAVSRVLDHNQFILGPEVRTLEHELAQFCGAKHVISCANGTDAIALVLMAQGVGPGQAVLCPSFTFAATAEAVAWVGATPLFVDVHPDTFNLDAASLELGIESAKKHDLVPVGVISVDLFGLPCDYSAIERFCEKHGLWLLSDAAQSFGASYKERNVGTIGLATTTSFFPAKPLGCYGDGGAIFTDDPQLPELLKSLRVHGEGDDKYDNLRVGLNSRLDTIQAAILIEKLKVFKEEIDRRNVIATRYNAALADVAATPAVPDGYVSIWAQYTIKVAAGKRDALTSALKAQGIPTAIYYRKPLHHQPAYSHFPIAGNGLPVSESVAQEVISLPMHAYLEADVQDRIVEAVRAALR